MISNSAIVILLIDNNTIVLLTNKIKNQYEKNNALTKVKIIKCLAHV